MTANQKLSRRQVLQSGAASAVLLAMPARPGVSTLPIDPYTGAIDMTFPLRQGTYLSFRDNWHESRVGKLSAWSHRLGKFQRAHDGVDVFPASTASLPAVYAPFEATVSAVCLYSGSTVSYKASSSAPPPWDYSGSFDGDVARFGNFIWLKSTANDDSRGFYAFYCHLQNDSVLQSILSSLGAGAVTVDTSTRVGTLGDSGNAAGEPQLHVEIHYPLGTTYTCTRCRPRLAGRTALDPYASLKGATVV